MTLPSPLFTINGGDPGAKASVAASSTVTCELDDLTGVTYVEWFIDTTDETTSPGNYTLSTTGGAVPGNETMTFTAGAAATGGIIRARINRGVNQATGNADIESTESTALWFVPTTIGSYEIFVDAEEGQSDLTHGQTGKLNQLIRTFGGSSGSTFAYLELGAGPFPPSGLIRVGSNTSALVARTASGGFANVLVSTDSSDRVVVGGTTRAAGVDLFAKTGGTIILKIGAGNVASFDGNGANFSVGTSLRINSNVIVSSPSDIPSFGSDSAAETTLRVGTGGSLNFKVNNVTEVTLSDAGINLASGNAYSINGAEVAAITGGALRFGSDTSAPVEVRTDSGQSIALKLGGSTVVSVEDTTATVTGDVIAWGFRTTAAPTKSEDFTANVSYTTYILDTASVSVTATLPPAASFPGRRWTFKKSSASNSAIVDGDGAETIDGSANYTMTANHASVTVESDGTGWLVVASHL